ncbi:MAG TPA: lamin tail domain-containing protein, partial [Chitinophagaceae bacterium]|nr:lamin tail domain-containing protein [Chitinophagaceae bacterium]
MKKLYFFLSVLLFAVTGTISAQVVINEVYGGGGNAGSTYKNDFIELYNNGGTAVDLTGWSVQYASAGGSSWQVTALTGSIPAHGYYLVQEAVGTGGTTNLPAPDATGTIPLSGTAGKVILCNTVTAQSGSIVTGPQIIDKVGYGTGTSDNEGAAAPAPSNTNSIQRSPIGNDTGNNSTDFVAGAPSPSNSGTGGSTPTITVSPLVLSGFTTTPGTASTQQPVTASATNLTADITITPSSPYEVSIDGGTNYSALPQTLTQTGGSVSNTAVNIRIAATAAAGAANGNVSFVSAGAATQSVTITGTVGSGITVDPPQSFGAAAVSTSEIDLTATGNATGNNILVATNSSASFGTPTGVLVAGNPISGGGTVLYNGPSAAFSFAHTGLTAGTTYYYEVWSVDGSNNYSATGLTASAATNAPPAANVVINQVYGGGGNSGATYKNDFIELYNNENTPVNLSGWSVQYSSAAGTGAWQVHALSGIVPPHSFFLIQEGAGAGGTVNLPTPDVTGTLAMGAASGKVLLSNSITAQTGANPAGATIMDKVGYGATASGFETAPAPGTETNTVSVARITDGADNNNNSTDFAVVTAIPRNSTYTTTAPGIFSLTPPNGTANVPYNISLSVIFDKKIVKGAGTITIYENGVAGTPLDVNDPSVVISNNTNLRFPSVLSSDKSYYVLISAGAFKDVYNNDFAGIASVTGWAFTTYNSTTSVAIPASFDFQLCTGSGLLPNGFTQYSVTGTAVWDCTPFGRDPAAPAGTAAFASGVQMNGFDNVLGNVLNTDWLISPALDLTGSVYPLLSFYSRTRFNGAPLQLKVSTNYTGTGDPNLADWTDLNGKFAPQTSDTWTASSNINLAAFKQPRVYIAFVYTSTNDDGARWTLDDINIINSATPPPPALTPNTNSIEFFYAAAGTTVAKTFTVIGNDLSGGLGININATGSFEVSKDGGFTYAPSVNLTEGTANNALSTIFVRFAPTQNNQNFTGTVTISTFGTTDTVINLKGTSIDPARTLEVVNWNMEWFSTPDPQPGFGPTNKALQRQNAQTILSSIGADLYALVEVVDTAALGNIVRTSMPGYSYIICNYGSHGNPFETGPTPPSPMGFLQKEAFVYKTSVFSNIDTTSLLSMGVNTAADLSNPNYNYWSSGRYPFMMTADVTLDGVTKTIRFVAIHAKANTAPTLPAYDRRKSGAIALHDYLNTTYPNDNIVILGDFNDDLDSTITDGIAPRLSSYKVFTDDVANFYSPTLVDLSLTGKKSTVAFSDVIDHVLVSNEMQPFFMKSSSAVLTDVSSLVTNYGSTTSDHYPVFTR